MIDLFEGFPHVCGRINFAELSLARALGINDRVLESSFADVESTAILRTFCALPSFACSKVIASEGCQMRGSPWAACGADMFHWGMDLNGCLKSYNQGCHIGVQG